MENLSVWPFAEAKMAVLYGTFAGIILAAGVEIVLEVFADDTIRPWGLRHTAGVLFVVASLMISLVA